MAAFRAFLKTEFSEENLEFWLACEDFKRTRSAAKLASRAHSIFEEFVRIEAPREVGTQRRPSPESRGPSGEALGPALGAAACGSGLLGAPALTRLTWLGRPGGRACPLSLVHWLPARR